MYSTYLYVDETMAITISCYTYAIICIVSRSVCFVLPHSAKTITTCCLPPYCDCLFVGTLGGITYPMDTEFDGMSPEVLSWSRARA